MSINNTELQQPNRLSTHSPVKHKAIEIVHQRPALHLQWVPSQVGVLSNERADGEARGRIQPAEVSTDIQVRVQSINAAIDNFTRKSLKDLRGNKSWKCFAIGDRIPMYLESAEEHSFAL
ncbi:hypothetical protein CDAR_392741 [Caerostris darwini]|uniref:RNase H type-1 domain-containing protein n=1 Tax=Caerostris darwini TaxID=1538125 RepID=A0AAV4SVB1_9ARAC|nr:hypothetical protein CDAR_392741 [Caerostris darwini]